MLVSIPIAYAARAPDDLAALRGRVRRGTLTVFFDVAYQSYLPSLVERDQLIEGNSKLEVTGPPPRSPGRRSAAG